jgi:hypothetical protein
MRVVAKLMTEDAKRTWRVSEGTGGLRRWAVLEEIGAEGLVLALARGGGDAEEASRVC